MRMTRFVAALAALALILVAAVPARAGLFGGRQKVVQKQKTVVRGNAGLGVAPAVGALTVGGGYGLGQNLVAPLNLGVGGYGAQNLVVRNQLVARQRLGLHGGLNSFVAAPAAVGANVNYLSAPAVSAVGVNYLSAAPAAVVASQSYVAPAQVVAPVLAAPVQAYAPAAAVVQQQVAAPVTQCQTTCTTTTTSAATAGVSYLQTAPAAVIQQNRQYLSNCP